MKHKAEPTVACMSDAAGERTLVVAAKNGDEQAFETLFKRYQRKTFAVVLRYTRVAEDAEDIVQQSFHKAFVHLWQFEGESSFSTWLTRIAINEALMFLRRIGQGSNGVRNKGQGRPGGYMGKSWSQMDPSSVHGVSDG